VFIVKKIFASILATVAILTLAGCAAPSTITVPASPSTPIALDPTKLVHVTWVLKSYGDVKNMTLVIPTGKDINLTFKGTLDGFTGSDGVNDYGGPCHIGNDGNIATSSITSTQIGLSGGNAREILKQAQTYYDLLQQAKTLSVNDDELVIYCNNGQAMQFINSTHPPTVTKKSI
jgi:heat shock protein HslJ